MANLEAKQSHEEPMGVGCLGLKLSSWTVFVDTVFGHVSMIGRMQVGKTRQQCLVYRMSCR